MNNEIKLNKELIKIVNDFFNVDVNNFKFLTKAFYCRDYFCLIYTYKERIFGVIITDNNRITFCELIKDGYNPVVFVEHNDEFLKLALDLQVGMAFIEYENGKTTISTMNCDPTNLKYGNNEYTYDGKIFDVDKILIVSRLEGFLV